MDEQQTIIDLTSARPAAIFVIDLVKHSSRPKIEIRRIQKILEDVFRETSSLLKIKDVHHKYTGDGYMCAFLGDSSAKAVDFINAAMPELRRRLAASDQAFRMGVDFGLLHLRSNELTHNFEHFDHAGIQAARLESAAQPNQILCTETIYQIFGPHYPEVFAGAPISITTKDRTIVAYEVHPFDYLEIQQAFSDYIYGASSVPNLIVSGDSRKSILVVDDEPQVLELVSKYISNAYPGIKVLAAADPQLALTLFTPGMFAIVITDAVMPGMNGMDLTERLLSLDGELVVIMMSGYSADFASRFYETGGFRFYNKPFDVHHLKQTLDLALNRRIPHLFRRLHVIGEKPGELIMQLQLISDSVHFVFNNARKEGHVAQSLIRHKVKHAVADFVKSVRPGNDILEKAELVRVQMHCLSRLAWVTSKAADSSFPIFIQQYIDDLKKQYKGLDLILYMKPAAVEAASNCSAEAIFGLVVCELIDNAITSLSGQGQVVVDFDVLTSTKQLKLTVQDNGRGILPENIPHIFSPGFSTKGTGRGLGLHLIREAIHRLSGTISYQTFNGACFTVVMPIEENKTS